jgi:hypothetical protein
MAQPPSRIVAVAPHCHPAALLRSGIQKFRNAAFPRLGGRGDSSASRFYGPASGRRSLSLFSARPVPTGRPERVLWPLLGGGSGRTGAIGPNRDGTGQRTAKYR